MAKIVISILILLLTLCVVLPIWLILLYKILVLVEATDLMWFLYWIYVPSTMISSTLANLLTSMKKDI